MKKSGFSALLVLATLLMTLAPAGPDPTAVVPPQPGIGGELPCFACTLIKVPDPEVPGRYSLRPLCWDFGTGIGYRFCQELFYNCSYNNVCVQE